MQTQEAAQSPTQNIPSEGYFQHAIALAKIPIIISLFLTPTRFLLELSGLPENAIFILGLLWLTLAFAVYWGINLHNEKGAYLLLFLSLLIYSPLSRLTVFAAWWVDKHWEIGTHYSLFFDDWPTALLNQVGYGSLVQITPGFVLGALVISLKRAFNSRTQ